MGLFCFSSNYLVLGRSPCMSKPTLTPTSTTSVSRLTATGSLADVDSVDYPLPFGIYTRHEDSSSNAFISGAVDQVAYVYKKLGGDILDIELTAPQVYAAYEEACLEYSYIVNVHQAKNVLSDVLGNSTGSFDQDGEMKSGEPLSGSNVELKYTKFSFSYSRRVGDGTAQAVGIGGLETIYSASFDKVNEQQDYDLQKIVASSSAGDLYNGKVGTKKVRIKKVYYKTPHAMWRFYGYYGGINTVGNMASYGQFADDSTFELIPTYQNKLQAKAFEDAIYTRISHFSYEVKNNKLRLFPTPHTMGPEKFWIEFTVADDAWEEDDDRQHGSKGINNMNTLPFANIPYININSIGKQWIRRFALSLCKEMLGLVRSKFATIPIPGESVTLNGSELITQGKQEQDALRDELKTTLDELTYQKLAEKDAAVMESTNNTMKNIPAPIIVG